MLTYATIGTKDLPRAAAFYDALLAEIGGQRVMEEPDYFIAWGTGPDGAGLGVTIPFDKGPATVGNGCMVALQASTRDEVDRLHARALALGGSDEGAPGQRPEGSTRPLRDLDGNKRNACYFGG